MYALREGYIAAMCVIMQQKRSQCKLLSLVRPSMKLLLHLGVA